jgi:hypothetical protein
MQNKTRTAEAQRRKGNAEEAFLKSPALRQFFASLRLCGELIVVWRGAVS